MGLRFGRPLALALASLCSAAAFSCLPIDVSFEKEKSADKVGVVRGVVQSTRGDVLENVRVTAGDAATITDDDGRYALKAPAGTTQLRFARSDYVDSFRSAKPTPEYPTQLDVMLLPRASATQLDARSGGEVTSDRGAALRVPEQAFSDASGDSVYGPVDVNLSAFDIREKSELAAAPDLATRIDGELQLIDSLGIVELRIEQDGSSLAFGSGKQAELVIPLAEDSQPSAALDAWHYDPKQGFWTREGSAVLDADSHTVVVRVKRTGLWSIGSVRAATCICGVVDEAGKGPLAGARIEVAGVSYSGSSSEQSDSKGRFCIAVAKESSVDVDVYHASTGGDSMRIQSKSAATLIPPKSTDPRCEDVGTWQVKKDASNSSD
jgi:hypothetical protein